MIAGLVIGKHSSTGVPGKNVRPVVGRPMVEYAFIAAQNSRYVEKIFVSTDSPPIVEIGEQYGAEHIERPPELATSDALTEDVLAHAYDEMQRRTGAPIEIVSLLFANAPTIRPGMVDRGIKVLLDDPSLDSAFSLCEYNMWGPLRTRAIDENNLIKPYIDPHLLGDPAKMSSIRGSEGDCYYLDLSVQILRDRCFSMIEEIPPPFKWAGKRSYALVSDYGFDVDVEWQFPVIDLWLREHGFTETSTPYDSGGLVS